MTLYSCLAFFLPCAICFLFYCYAFILVIHFRWQMLGHEGMFMIYVIDIQMMLMQ